MKLTAFLAAFPAIGFATARPLSTDLTGNPVRGLVKRGVHLVWDPVDAYRWQGNRRRKWQETCQQALAGKGCIFGIIHQGVGRTMQPSGEVGNYYVNVEAGPSMDMRDMKRMRVFEDASVELEDGEDERNVRAITEAASRGRRVMKKPQPSKVNKALLFWDPDDAYKDHHRTRSYWEHSCDVALTREGCGVGVIHKGTRRTTKDGERTVYVNVHGAPLFDMEKLKRLRVYRDASTEDFSKDGWTEWDLGAMTGAKRPRKAVKDVKDVKDAPRLEEERKALIFWDPEDVYKDQPRRRLYWEHRCDVALTREGCGIGLIHKGIKRTAKNGEMTSYVNVLGAPWTDMENPRKLRVYEDTSTEDFSENGWTEEDYRLIKDAKTPRKRPARKASTQVHSQGHASHTITWDPPDAYQNWKRFRRSYEKACHKALVREACDFGIIHKGLRDETKPDGTKSHYLTVTAGNHDDPDPNKKIMWLFEDGSSVWHPLGPQPMNDVKGEMGRRMIPRRKKGRDTIGRSRMRTRTQQSTTNHQAQGASSSARVEGSGERPKKRPKAEDRTSLLTPAQAT